ncbi:branched-chain amino acid ABC transporter permease [Azospirillum thiophilum]|uniref:branched-chain amino acid ABC transporter permease n=1 Tax=Azospirillum thiophilum TaxID=528244 RepID=UPI00069813C5|nr:branched-chain amino acid ABC transporter permease [Azospirillum thiophilum]
MKTGLTRILPYAAILLVTLTLIWIDRPFWIQLAIGVAITAVTALAWDILSRTGQVSLGSAAFFGIGSYALALFEPLVGLALAWVAVVVVCALAATLLGLLTLRLRRMYFAIATLGFALSMQVLVVVFPDWTGGAGGIAPPVLAGGDPRWQLALIGLLLLAAAGISDLLLGLRFRPAFFMIRTKPELATASGVPVVRMKIFAFIVSGVLIGLAGACYGGLYGYVVPTDVFTTNWSVLPLAIATLGGMDTTIGPLLGAVVLKALEEVARSTIGGTGYQVVYGAVIILFVIGMPQGIVGLLRRGRGLLARSGTAKKKERERHA